MAWSKIVTRTATAESTIPAQRLGILGDSLMLDRLEQMRLDPNGLNRCLIGTGKQQCSCKHNGTEELLRYTGANQQQIQD